jgi:chromosome segregation ATPase
VKQYENKILLDEVLEREIALYKFENSVSRAAMDAERKHQEAQKRYEEAQKRYEEAQKRYEEVHNILVAIQESRIWRFTSTYRKFGSKVKAVLRSSTPGEYLLRILRKLTR